MPQTIMHPPGNPDKYLERLVVLRSSTQNSKDLNYSLLLWVFCKYCKLFGFTEDTS